MINMNLVVKVKIVSCKYTITLRYVMWTFDSFMFLYSNLFYYSKIMYIVCFRIST